MNKIRNQIFKVSILLMVITALIVGMAVPTLAAPSSATTAAGALRTIQGTVGAVSTSSLTVHNGSQTPVVITVDQNTKYYQMSMGKAQPVASAANQENRQGQKEVKPMPPKANDLKNARIPDNWRETLSWLDSIDTSTKLADIQVGDRVIARITNETTNLARQILLVKAPVIQQVKGTIAAVAADSITITPVNASAVTLKIDAKTRTILTGLILVQNGHYAVVTYNRTTMVAQLINVQPVAPTAAVVKTLTSIAITPVAPANLAVGATQQFTATGTYSNNTTFNITGQVTWASSDIAKATITSPGGLAKGIAAGSSSVTASLNGITSAAVVLTVIAAP